MDPYIEAQLWDEFHNSFIEGLGNALVPLVRPDYVVRRERRVYIAHDDSARVEIIPDVSIVRAASPARSSRSAGDGTAVLPPIQITLPMPVEHRETFLTIRDSHSLEVITVVELLSPTNKRPGSTGRDLYLAKRDEVLASSAHFVEIDLLRAGGRMPASAALPRTDYCVILSRASQRPRAEAWCWGVRDPLPTIPIPLANGHSSVDVPLQAIFTERFDGLGYDYSLSRDVSLHPPLNAEDQAWAEALIPRPSAKHDQGTP